MNRETRFDTQENYLKLLKKYDIQNPNEARFFNSKDLLATHGTRAQNLSLILKDQEIHSYRSLLKHRPSVVKDNQMTTTDELDVTLGLDKYAFFTVGRATISELFDAILCFDFPVLGQTKNALVSLMEIADFGAMVSKESVAYFRQHYKLSIEDCKRLNAYAQEQFFGELLNYDQFQIIFHAFIKKHFESGLDFVSASHYPTRLIAPKEVYDQLPNPWRPGPQLMVPNKISIQPSLYAIIDIFCNGSLQIALKKGNIAKEKVLKSTQVLQYLQQKNLTNANDLLIKNKNGYSNKVALFVNLMVHYLGILHAHGYDGDITQGVCDMV